MESQGQISAPLPSLGGALGVALLSLGLVCVLAYGVLRFLARRGVGRPSGPIRVLARASLEPRRSLYLVEVAGRRLLLGVGDGPTTTLADLGAGSEVPAESAMAPTHGDLPAVELTPAAPSGASEGLSVAPVPQASSVSTTFRTVLDRVRGPRPGAGAP